MEKLFVELEHGVSDTAPAAVETLEVLGLKRVDPEV